MKNVIKIIDTHVHIGNKEKCREIVSNSPYKNIYKLYDSINVEALDYINEYTKELDNYFAMPMVFKETNISIANEEILIYANKNRKAIPVLLVPNDDDFDSTLNKMRYNILKEHFLLHLAVDYKKRIKSYQYLSDVNGFLLLHPLSNGVKEYISMLRKNFPNMNIIVAHLGRNGNCDELYTKEMIEFCSMDSKIYSDISTITNLDLIKYAIEHYKVDKILFGSDFPCFQGPIPSIKAQISYLERLELSLEQFEKILYFNAKQIINLVRKQ